MSAMSAREVAGPRTGFEARRIIKKPLLDELDDSEETILEFLPLKNSKFSNERKATGAQSLDLSDRVGWQQLNLTFRAGGPDITGFGFRGKMEHAFLIKTRLDLLPETGAKLMNLKDD